jgi:hypothetical protein
LAPRGDPSKDFSEEDTLTPSTEEEFEQVKTSLREEKPIPKGMSVRGHIPWLRDHSIELYLDKIRGFLGKKETHLPKNGP